MLCTQDISLETSTATTFATVTTAELVPADNVVIPISENGDRITVLGRDLHKALKIETAYTTWFKRMCEYGFKDGVDYVVCFPNSESGVTTTSTQGGQNKIDHQLTLDMAKHLAMIQRTAIGYKVRQYFIDVEKKWRDEHTSKALIITEKFKQGDSGAAVDWLTSMGAAMTQAAKLLQQEREKNQQLTGENESLKSSLAAMQPKINYVDVVLNHPGLITTTIIAKDYGYTTMKFNKLLHKLHIVFKQSGIWQLYAEYAALGWGKNKTTYQDNTGCVVIHNYFTRKLKAPCFSYGDE